jgi:copper oxidase (laccase) domain-containing protein
VTTRLVEKLCTEFGCRCEDLVAGISPSAGPCCYRVGAEVVDAAVRELGIMAERFFRVSGGKFIFDLWGANRRQLQAAGVPDAKITAARVCTICHNDTYPSYRAEGAAAGRFVAVIGRPAGECL